MFIILNDFHVHWLGRIVVCRGDARWLLHRNLCVGSTLLYLTSTCCNSTSLDVIFSTAWSFFLRFSVKFSPDQSLLPMRDSSLYMRSSSTSFPISCFFYTHDPHAIPRQMKSFPIGLDQVGFYGKTISTVNWQHRMESWNTTTNNNTYRQQIDSVNQKLISSPMSWDLVESSMCTRFCLNVSKFCQKTDSEVVCSL
jgi:hypothetical protein